MRSNFNYFAIVFCCLLLSVSCKKKDSATPEPEPVVPPVVVTPTVTPTNTDIPTVLTVSVTSITDTSAVSGGSVTSEGATVITAVGVCWDEQPNPTLLKNRTIDGAGVGSYSSKLKNLKPNTTYYLRAYASNLSGTAYGTEVTFKTAKSTKWVSWSNGLLFGYSVRQFASAGSNLFVATSNGIAKSVNGDNNWSPVNSGLSSTNINCLIAKNSNLFAGNADGVYLSTNAGAAWTEVSSTAYASDLAEDGTTVYSAHGDYVYATTTNGSSWSDVTPAITSPGFNNVTASGTSVFVYDQNNNKIRKTTDHGATWTAVTPLPSTVSAIKIVALGSDLFACSYSGLHKLTGNSWTQLNGFGNYPVYTVIKEGDTLYAGSVNNVYSSTDNGSTWIKVGDNLPNAVNALIAFQGYIYAGSYSGGIYRFGL